MSDTTTVNVKNIRVEAWSTAKHAARRNDESLGSWISRACEQLAAAEAGGPRLIPPPARLNQGAEMANPAARVPTDRLAQLATLARIARELTPDGKDSRAAQMARRAVCLELAGMLQPPIVNSGVAANPAVVSDSVL
jgi:hypothetical protein